MMIVGLTGSIGMGKSTAAKMLRQMGVPVYDADAAVHALQAPGGAALPPIEAAFPGVVKAGVLDRQALGARVFGNKEALRKLEAIVHPLVGRKQRAFLKRAALRGAGIVVLDIPLLFEGRGERRVDAVLVVSAPSFLQRRRVLARPAHDRGKIRRHPAPAGPRFAEAPQGKRGHPDRSWAGADTRRSGTCGSPVEAAAWPVVAAKSVAREIHSPVGSRASQIGRGEGRTLTCARSSWIPKRLASILELGTVSSKWAVSSW